MQFDIKRLTETVSTNDDAKTAAGKGVAAGTTFWALKQSGGRGRQGRQWASPEGNLYCSTILRPLGGTTSYGLYSFVTALALWDSVHALLPDTSVELKWPNDVLVGGKKISGILLEAGDDWLVIGIGMNVLLFPENSLYPVTSLAAETPDVPTLENVLSRVLAALALWSERLEKDGFAPIRAAWLERARKGAMRVRLPDKEIHGEFGDLDAQGNLHLILPDKTTIKVSAGDVFF